MNENLSKILFLNLFTNSKTLNNLQTVLSEKKKTTTGFENLSNNELFSRLISDVDFESLSKEEKSNFCFFAQKSDDKSNLKISYEERMKSFIQEAHNRMCDYLKVPPTTISFCDFKNSEKFIDFSTYEVDFESGNIYLNTAVDYLHSRPSFLIETLAGATLKYKGFQDVFKIASEPNSFSDKDFFIGLSTAIRLDLKDEFVEKDNELFSMICENEYAYPDSIQQKMDSFTLAKICFKSSGLYGGELRKSLLKNEKDYYSYLSESYGNDSLLAMEDLVDYFRISTLNQSSNNLLFGLLKKVNAETSSKFYNSIGAEMQNGQDIGSYINQIEKEKFEEYGIEVPTEQELSENEFFKNGLQSSFYGEDDEQNNYGYDENGNVISKDKEIDRIMDYKPMEIIIPKDFDEDQIISLPFHKATNSALNGIQDLQN